MSQLVFEFLVAMSRKVLRNGRAETGTPTSAPSFLVAMSRKVLRNLRAGMVHFARAVSSRYVAKGLAEPYQVRVLLNDIVVSSRYVAKGLAEPDGIKTLPVGVSSRYVAKGLAELPEVTTPPTSPPTFLVAMSRKVLRNEK